MTLENRINAFVLLGQFLKQFPTNEKVDELSVLNEIFYDEFEYLILRQKSLNGWFDKDSVLFSLSAISSSLTKEGLTNWIDNYTLKESENKRIGVIMAGNIPLVGFHDFLTVLITGNTILAKMSSTDNTLLKKIGELLLVIEPELKNHINFVEKLENFDAVFATGSNNSARYFEAYFGKYPHVIRKNRNSIGIINEKDIMEDLKPLGKDIFQYYGLGCRNVSKLYFPKGYKIDTFFEAIFEDYQNVVYHNKYANNYDYHKAIYLLDGNQLLDNDFVLLKEESSLTSPVGVLYYEFYEDVSDLKKKIKVIENEIQCIVSSKNTPIDTFAFGEAQCPNLNDYADGVDTVEFLINLA
jgi:hypothetical protein